MNDAACVTALKPGDPATIMILFPGFAAFVAFFSVHIDTLNVLSMSTAVGELPGMPDEQEHPNVRLRLEFLNAELAQSWCNAHQQRLAAKATSFQVEPLGPRKKPPP